MLVLSRPFAYVEEITFYILPLINKESLHPIVFRHLYKATAAKFMVHVTAINNQF